VKRWVALLLVLTACGSAAEPRSLTTSEAERLALVRFTNYSAGVQKFTASVPSPGGKLLLDGRVDFVNHQGFAAMRTDGRDDEFSRGLVMWNLRTMGFAVSAASAEDIPPDARWQVRDLQEKGSELDAALRLLVNLGSDRPDNAQLLQQSSARWMRVDRVGESAVDVLEGPQQAGKKASADGARLRYWVDADGRLKRLEAKLGDQQELAVFDLTGAGAPLPKPSP
jgi:hypothetical protein